MRSPGADLHGFAAVLDVAAPRDTPRDDSHGRRRGGHRALLAVEHRRRAVAATSCEPRAQRALRRRASTFGTCSRTVLPALVVLFALSLPGLVAGSIFVETVFAWPGMGRLMVNAIVARDYPLVMGAAAIYAALVLLRESRRRHRAAARRSAATRMRILRVAPPNATPSRLAMLAALALAVIVVPMLSHQDPLGIGDVLALRLLAAVDARRSRQLSPARHRSFRARPVRADDARRTNLARRRNRRLAPRKRASERSSAAVARVARRARSTQR